MAKNFSQPLADQDRVPLLVLVPWQIPQAINRANERRIVVQPPSQWVAWGIVPKGVVWKLRRTVHGLRQSPKWWADERDSKLRTLRWTVGNDEFYLEQNEADSQVWSLHVTSFNVNF